MSFTDPLQRDLHGLSGRLGHFPSAVATGTKVVLTLHAHVPPDLVRALF